MYKVRFVVHDNSKNGSYPIKVVGNLPELGNWNPVNGFEMEEYYDRQWESTKQLQIPNGQQFEFKLVKMLGNNEVEWEQLPNNSNRKFKPKFNTKLILKWSSHIGQAINEAKSSMKLKGLPGVMVNDHKQGGLLKKKLKKKKKNILSDSDTNSENENDSFCVGRKKSSDIRQNINSGDIEEIYYDTTELQNAYHSFKQIQVFIISTNSNLNKQFQQKIDEQLKELIELQNFKFKWLFFGEDQCSSTKFKRIITFKKIQKNPTDKIYLEQFQIKNVHRNYFIFVDLEAALRTDVGHSSASLYLPSEQYEKSIKYLKELQKFQLICFDSAEANRNLLKIFEDKRIQTQKSSLKIKKRQQSKSDRYKPEKNFGQISLQKILDQLQLWQVEISINTVHTYTKKEAIANILQPNSILLLDSQIMKTDKTFFYRLLDERCEKRLIIIIHKVGVPEWVDSFSQCKNVCIILDNFMKLHFLGKLYDPSKKHRNAIQFIQMRAKLFEKSFGGSWQITDNSFTYKFEGGTISKAKNIQAQIENVLIKDFNYFKFHMKENRLKITWNLSHPVRLLRTLIRIKSIEEGQIGNFYLLSRHENYSGLKQQIRLLINTNSYIMVEGKETQIYDFGFGNSQNAKYSIKSEQERDSQSSTSSTELDSEALRMCDKKLKLESLQKKYSLKEDLLGQNNLPLEVQKYAEKCEQKQI